MNELVDDVYTIFMNSIGEKTTATRQNAFKLWRASPFAISRLQALGMLGTSLTIESGG
jgi:hypothetical protein